MQSVEYHDINGNKEKVFNEPFKMHLDAMEAQNQLMDEMQSVSAFGGHVEVFEGTPENIKDRSKLSRQSRRRLERLEKKANKKQ